MISNLQIFYYVWKKVFKTLAVFLSSLLISSTSISVIFSLVMLLFDNKASLW